MVSRPPRIKEKSRTKSRPNSAAKPNVDGRTSSIGALLQLRKAGMIPPDSIKGWYIYSLIQLKARVVPPDSIKGWYIYSLFEECRGGAN